MLVSLSVPPAGAAPWYEHYENAERALANEAWRDAVDQLQQAIERRGDSGYRTRTYGMRVTNYFPYLRLGIAYHHLGQHAAALEAFDTEERLAAIGDASNAVEELRRYRTLAAAARDQVDPVSDERVAALVADSRRRAEALAADGRLDEAVLALAPGLAANPDDTANQALMTRLSEALAQRDEDVRRRQQVAAHRREAKAHLDAGAFDAAADLLRQVVAADDDPEAQAWLAAAQRGIAERVVAEQRSARIANAFDEARRLGDAGRVDDALRQLETVLALDGDHLEGKTLRARLLADRDAARDRTQIERWLADARDHAENGRFEASLAIANRALARDPGNRAALTIIGTAYTGINRQLLTARGDPAPIENLPPALRFADRRRAIDGQAIEIVRRADFQLTGVVIDGEPVDVVVTDDAGRALDVTLDHQRVGTLVVSELRVRHTLGPGLTTLTAIATDDAGARSRSQYLVRYDRPLTEAPWFLPAAAGLPLLVLALVVGHRLRRWRAQRLRLARRFNPYVAGGPIFDERLFFGREALIQRVLQSLPNNSLLLFGERRIGKTSLLHQLHQRLTRLDDDEFAFFPVYIDLQGTPETAFFATLADATFDAAQEWVDTPTRVPARERDRYGHHDLARELRALLQALRTTTERHVKLVWLIDEIDELNRYDPRVNQSLRSLFMRRFAEHLSAVVAGVGIRKSWEQEGSPWYNFFEEIAVDALAPEDAEQLVREPVRGTFDITPDAARRIVERTGGKPFAVQRLCLALVQHLHETGRRRATVEDVDTVHRAMTTPTGPAS